MDAEKTGTKYRLLFYVAIAAGLAAAALAWYRGEQLVRGLQLVDVSTFQQGREKTFDFTIEAYGYKSGISDLLAPNGPFIHPRAAERTKFCSSPNRPAPEAVTAARSDVEATGAAAFRAFLRHRSTRVPLLRHAGFVALSPRVSLPARVVPRSSAACRRTAAWSDALLPGGASSTGRASRAGPRSSPAAAGDS